MLKIFVTGDNHIGLKYASHEASAQLASCRISAFEGMVDAANREGCELFAITGDLFENTYGVAKRDIQTLLGILSGFNGIVAVLPGNHDYYDADVKVWQYFKDAAASYDNILLLCDNRPYELTLGDCDVILYPAPCRSLHSASGQNNLEWIKNEDIPSDGAYRIGIAHGAVEGETIDNEGRYFLMTRDELESIPVDVWLIGHTHVPFPRDLTETLAPAERIFNAGTHVQTDVSCNTEGQCFMIEISDDKTVRAKKYTSGALRFYRRNITLNSESVTQRIESELADIGDNSVVDIILGGAISAEEYAELIPSVEKALARFTEGTYDCYAVSRLISRELIASEFPETSFCAKFLGALLDEPKEAQLAYELLKSLKGEK